MKRVYFIKPINLDGPIKIGCSRSPDGRLETLATWSPFPLELLASIEGDFELERRFRTKFKELHQGREWFRYSSELRDTIQLIVAGDFDVSTLPAPSALPRKLSSRKAPTWTPEKRLLMSYTHRIRHAERASGMFLPYALRTWRGWLGDPEKIAPVDAFLQDPKQFGETKLQRLRAQKHILQENKSPWARKVLAELEELELEAA